MKSDIRSRLSAEDAALKPTLAFELWRAEGSQSPAGATSLFHPQNLSINPRSPQQSLTSTEPNFLQLSPTHSLVFLWRLHPISRPLCLNYVHV